MDKEGTHIYVVQIKQIEMGCLIYSFLKFNHPRTDAHNAAGRIYNVFLLCLIRITNYKNMSMF